MLSTAKTSENISFSEVFCCFSGKNGTFAYLQKGFDFVLSFDRFSCKTGLEPGDFLEDQIFLLKTYKISLTEWNNGVIITLLLDGAGQSMKVKDESIIAKLLECAKAEFMEKGFADASMRTIAERAGVTTGMLYSRFADKDEMFRYIVSEGAEKLYAYFSDVQENFAAFPAEQQKGEMHSYTSGKMRVMMDIIYDYFDSFKLIVLKSAGSSYEHYIDRMIDYETESTERFMRVLRESGAPVRTVRRDINHMLASALFNGVFEVVAHDFPKEDAMEYVDAVCEFFYAGWDRLMGLS